MKELNIEALKPGMKFDAPVYIDERNILVPPGIPLRAKDLERLKRWEIKTVKTEGNLIQDEIQTPSNDQDNITIQQLLTADTEREDIRLYETIVEQWHKILNTIRRNGHPGKELIDRIVNDIYINVRDKKNELVQVILKTERKSGDEAANDVNCAVIAIIIGLNLKLVGHKIISLACGALLHDVGMFRIPEAILNKKDNLSPQELEIVRTHPLHSYNIIARELKYSEEIAQIALYHHERWDGKGYPKSLSGESIPLLARIVSVADAYTAMINERPYREQMIGYDAIKNIISDNFKRFDPNVVKAFLRGMGIYPIGSVVLLNNSSVAVVLSTHSEAPLRPEVEIIINEHGEKPKDKKVIDLLEHGELFIVRAIDPRQIKTNE